MSLISKVRSKSELVEYASTNPLGKDDFVLFYGHSKLSDPRTALSQFFKTKFTVDGTNYTSAEQFMMAGKARTFKDFDALKCILEATLASECKKIGRAVRNFDKDVWDNARFDIVVRGNVAKFGANARIRDYLISTHPKVLVECAPRDQIWGIGLGAENEKALNPNTWRGRNLLGFALMEARSRLRQQGSWPKADLTTVSSLVSSPEKTKDKPVDSSQPVRRKRRRVSPEKEKPMDSSQTVRRPSPSPEKTKEKPSPTRSETKVTDCKDLKTQDVFDKLIKIISKEKLNCDSDDDIESIIDSLEKYKEEYKATPCEKNIRKLSKIVDHFVENLKKEKKGSTLCEKLEKYNIKVKTMIETRKTIKSSQ